MHEMAITHSLVELCEEKAGGRRISEVKVEVGELSGVVPEALEFCFEACTKDTGLEGARLVIERIPAYGRCDACATEYRLQAHFDPCPSCGGYRVSIRSGEELRLKELEVSEDVY